MLAILSTHPIQYQVPLWQALARDGSVPFEVWYLSAHGTDPSYDPQFGKSFAWDLDVLSGYPYRFLKTNPDSDVTSFGKLRLAERLQPRLSEKKVTTLWVQGWHVRAYWQAVWQAHNAGVSVWLRGESNDLATTPTWKQPVKQLMLRQLFTRVKNFLYIGEANRRLYERYGVGQEQMHPAPYCVDNARFAEQAEALRSQRTEIRRAWNIPDDAFCVLFAGKFIEKKRPFDLINAAKDQRLSNQNQPLHLLLVGSGELDEALRNATNGVFDAELGGTATTPGHDTSKPSATFAGFLNQKEISKAYVAADCLVLPSDHRETWGLVVNEAMASGLPCVVSDACGCAEDLITPVRPEARYPMGDTSALANALLDVMERPISSAAVQGQVGEFDPQLTVNTVRKLFYSSKESPVESANSVALTQ